MPNAGDDGAFSDSLVGRGAGSFAVKVYMWPYNAGESACGLTMLENNNPIVGSELAPPRTRESELVGSPPIFGIDPKRKSVRPLTTYVRF